MIMTWCASDDAKVMITSRGAAGFRIRAAGVAGSRSGLANAWIRRHRRNAGAATAT